MKRKLFLSGLCLTLFNLSLNAQDHVWDLGNDALWPAANASTSGFVRDGLTVGPSGGSNFRMQLNSPAPVFSDGYTAPKGFFFPTNSTVANNLPSNLFFKVPVNGPCQLKIWSWANAARIVYISNGTNLLKSTTLTGSSSNYYGIITYDYTGSAGDLYIYANSQLYIYKISVSTAPLGTDDFKTESASNVYSNGNQVYVANVKSKTAVSVYSLSGTLTKTLETAEDTAFTLETGVWIVKIKSAQGEKSVKLLVK